MLESYSALTEGAGLLERSDRGRLRLTGVDRKTYLQGVLTNDIVGLEPGSGCYAAMLTPQGRMIADMRVLETGDAILLETDASLAPMLRERLDQFIFSEDVAVEDVSASIAQLSVHGLRAARAVARGVAVEADADRLEARLSKLSPMQSLTIVHNGMTAVVAASDDLGVPGFDLYVPRGGVEGLASALRAAGAAPVEAAAAEALRIEAGRPAYLKDMTADTIPLEAGIEDRAISLTKGCYVGQEIIIRVLHRGHGRVARRLVGLLVDGGVVPEPGDMLRVEGRDVGSVTSAVRSPALGRPIAMGYVHRDFTAPGTKVGIVRADSLLTAHVAAFPFVHRQVPSGPPA